MDTIDKDKGYKRIMGQMDLMKKAPHVVVGFFAGDNPEGGDQSELSVADYMWLNEVGTIDIPERPVMGETTDAVRPEVEAMLKRELEAIIQGRSTVEGALTKVGIKFKAELQKAITDFNDPANAESTIDQKGADNPLIDTGTARNAVSFEVRMKEKP